MPVFQISVVNAGLGTSKKVEAIKWVRQFTGFGLKEAKDAVEGAQFAWTTSHQKANELNDKIHVLNYMLAIKSGEYLPDGTTAVGVKGIELAHEHFWQEAIKLLGLALETDVDDELAETLFKKIRGRNKPKES